MAVRDRREDPGQYYPGGSVVPKTPTGQGGGGTSDYDQLANKPKINNHELTGNKTAAQLGLATPSDIPDVLGKLPLRALPKYLHYLAFDDTYPADAAWLYAQLGPSDLGRCSAVRRGGKLFRNYDWTFDDAAEFVVKMSGNATRFASVGVASVGSRLTENEVMSAVNSRYYKCLPGMTLDGINEKGVVCEINVDGGPKYGWHGDADEGGIHILAAVRWVLDHGETAAQAAEWIADHIIQPQGEMNFHFMVADTTSTYIVENGVAHLVPSSLLEGAVLTNYALYDEAHAGGGKERYTLLAGGADISAVNFTNAYQSGNTWDSDFESAEQHAAAIEQWAAQGETKEAHRGKTTTGGKAWWQSVHTTEYDFAAKTMKVAVQEVDDWYTFAVDQANVDLSPIEAQIAALQSGKQDKITASGVLKGNGSGGVSAASPSSTGGANADYRDPKDNTCHKTEFGEWTLSYSDGIDHHWEPPIVYGRPDLGWANRWVTSAYPLNDKTDPNETVLVWRANQDWDQPFTMTATRSAVCTDGKKFVTEDVAAKQSDIPALATPSESATDAQAAKAKSTYDFVNSSINAMAAFYITKNAAGDSFATKAELTAAIASGTFYNGGQPRTPTKNDYLYILADESHPTAAGTSPTTRYSFDGTQWSFQIVVNDTALTAAQLAAMNSGINAALVTWLTTFKGTDTTTTLASIIAKLAHLESDGTADDDFATDLLGKSVAINALHYALYSVPTSGADANKLKDRAVNEFTFTGSLPTFPAQVAGYARDFLLNVTATADGSDITIPEPDGSTATSIGDALAFTAGKTYLVAITEIAAKHYYIRVIDTTPANAA